MDIKQSTVNKLSITNLKNLDPLSVYIEDYKPGQGKLTIECFGDAWSYYWNAMGNRNLIEFLKQADIDYITGKLFPHELQRHIIDYDKISTETERDVDEHTLMLYEDEIADIYGKAWMFELPKKESHQWEYLYRIVSTLKEAIQQL